jgi:hypothetical protein
LGRGGGATAEGLSAANVKSFAALGDGATDDTGAIRTAIARAAAARLALRFPPGTYKSRPLIIDATVKLIFEPGASLVPLFDTSGDQKFITVAAPNVEITGATFGPCGGISNNNRYIMYAGPGADGLKLNGCTFANLVTSDGMIGRRNLFATHAIYLEGIQRVEINSCVFDAISGAAIFGKMTSAVRIINCMIKNTRWYSINADHDCYGWEIASNIITGDDSLSRYWGGSVNLMSQTTGRPNSDFEIHDNFFDGVHNYGAVVRCLSITRLRVHHNVYGDRIQTGRIEPGGRIQYIAIDRRGAVDLSLPQNGPCRNIHVHDELMHAGPGVSFAIYVKNSGVSKRDPHRNILIERIQAFSTTPSQRFASLAMIHGLMGGIERIRISDCVATLVPARGVPLPGGIGIASTNERGEIAGAELRGNRITSLSRAKPRQAFEIGIFIEPTASGIELSDNTVENFRYGIRIAKHGVSRVSGIRANRFINCTEDEF